MKDYNRLYSFFLEKCKSYGFQEEAEDITQDIMLRKLIGKNKPINQTLIELYRKNLVRTKFNPNVDTPEYYEISLEDKLDYTNILSLLDKKTANIINLKYKEDLSYIEIASLYNISPPRVRQIINEGLYKLRTVLI